MLRVHEVVKQLKELLCVVKSVISNEDLYDEYKYDLIFSKSCSGVVKELLSEIGITLSYYDPDTSYMADILAYKNALEEVVNPLFESLINKE